MSKYEWEKELKKQLSALPEKEQKPIFDYYGEMFEDRFESGMSEADIIREFGNPYDVAQKILADRAENDCRPSEQDRPAIAEPKRSPAGTGNQTPPPDGPLQAGRGTAEADPAAPLPPQEGGRSDPNQIKSTGRKATAGDTAARIFAAALLGLFAGLPLLAVLFSLAVTGAALFLTGFALILAGFVYFIYFILQIILTGAAGGLIAHLGLGLGLAALGFLLVPLFLQLTRLLFRGCAGIFALTRRIITGKGGKTA